jgi:hypothetical protein
MTRRRPCQDQEWLFVSFARTPKSKAVAGSARGSSGAIGKLEPLIWRVGELDKMLALQLLGCGVRLPSLRAVMLSTP